MKPPSHKSPPKKRNLAAKALSDPVHRPKIIENPAAYKRRVKFTKKPVNPDDDDQIN